MGNFKYYLAPKGVIKVDELPAKWGLLEYNEEKDCIDVVKEPERVIVPNSGELGMLCSIMRREGIKPQIFNYRNNETQNRRQGEN